MTPERRYADRSPSELEPYYSAHVAAMTAEGLHSKAAIAAELAFRDAQIAKLREAAEYALFKFGDEYEGRLAALREAVAATAPEGERDG